MKKLLFIIVIAVTAILSSCTTSKLAINGAGYKQNMQAVTQTIQEIDSTYVLSQQGHTENNNVVVSGVSYNQYTGYGTAMANQLNCQDSYTFTNAAGDNIEFTLTYQPQDDIHGNAFFESIYVSNCKTSNNKVFQNVCGNEGAIVNKINTKNTEVSVYDKGKTIATTCGISIGASIILLIILCL